MNQQFQLQNSINYLRNIPPEIVKNIAHTEIQALLTRNRSMLSLATDAVFQTILEDPSKMLFINSLSDMDAHNPFQGELEIYRSQFIDLVEKTYQNLSFQCAKGMVDFIVTHETSLRS